jgi:hypothetical protein
MTLRQLDQQIERWNNRYPVGTEVIYHPVIGEKEGHRTRTLTLASLLSGHTAVVFVEGVRGCVALDALTPIPPVEQ